MSFGKWTRLQIQNTGLTWVEFQKRSGFTSGVLQQWTSDDRRPRLSSFIVFCEVIATVQMRPFDVVLIEGLTHMSEYQYAVKRGVK